MNVLTPCVRASSVSSSAHWSGGPSRNPRRSGRTSADVEQPADGAAASGRRRRPPRRWRRCHRRARSSGDVAEARQPAVGDRARSAGACAACSAPSQISISCAGAGPRLAPFDAVVLAGHAGGARAWTSQIARMTSIASASASTASPGVRRGPPMASIASQNAPAPRPSSTRPPVRMSRLAALRARTGGLAQRQVGDVRRDRTVGGLRGDDGQQRPRVEERRLVRVVLEGDEVEPGELGELRERDDGLGIAGSTA